MRVLLVDKEADLLPALQETLLSVEGLELYCAPDGPTALQHATLLNGVDVLLTEVFLPGVDGVALRDAVQPLKPSMRTVFLTRHDLGAHAEALRDHQLLQVPVDPELVLAALLAPQAPTPVDSTSLALPRKTTPAPTATEAPSPTKSHFQPEEAPIHTAAPQNIPTRSAPSAQTPNQDAPRQTAQTIPLVLEKSAPKPPVNRPSTPFKPKIAQLGTLQVGALLGPYQLLRREPDTSWGPCFAAVHTTLGRTVHLVILAQENLADSALKGAFLADASAKARAQHPALLAVYEAGELDGYLFYAIERLEANALQNLLQKGASLPLATLKLTARTVAEGLQYFGLEQISHPPLSSTDIFLGSDENPRLQNIATESSEATHGRSNPVDDIATLGNALHALLPLDAPENFRRFLERTTSTHPRCISSWDEFLDQLAAQDQNAGSLNRDANADILICEEVDARSVLLTYALRGLGIVSVLGISAAAAWHFLRQEPTLPRQIQIPAGQYLVGAGRKANLISFTIDATEISNRHYSYFVDWLRLHPKEAGRYDHPEQPSHQNHVPEGWAQRFPEKIHRDPRTQNPEWDLPVAKVSWWDAYAFANWAGRALPTEEEWEAAGRGPRGFLFPWGDEPEPERAQVKRTDAKPGESNASIAVQSLKDASAFGVLGLCGNVSEWTATKPDAKTAVAKGNHFDSPLLSLDARTAISTETHSPRLGFRTVSRKATP